MIPSASPTDLRHSRRGDAGSWLELFPVTPHATRFLPEMTSPALQAVRVRSLVDQHFAFVWRYLRGLGVPVSEVDDAAQQVFVVAAQKIDAIHEGSERSFLVGTARGVAANARRAGQRRREVAVDDGLDAFRDHGPDAEEQARTREELAILDGFLASLPEDVREIFVLFELEGFTMASIAHDLGLPPGTVASRLRRAREAFQEMAKRYRAIGPQRGES
jgi:RNA polymerase sigma-70 factor (ECF subfamily)